VGGKLTTFRLMAEKASDLVAARLGNTAPCRTTTELLPSGPGAGWTEPGASARDWMRRVDPTDTILCECEMVARSTVDEIVATSPGHEEHMSLEAIARRDGMDLDQVKTRLVEMYAPEEVINMEVTKRVSVSDSEVAAFYENNQETFFVEGEVTLREIVLLADNDEKKAERRSSAQEIWQRATSGELFGPLAKEFSDAGTASNGGEFGPLKKSDLSEMLVEAAFTLPIGGVSELMETPYGFHIIKVVSRMEDHTEPLEEVSDRIRNYLRDQKFKTDLEAFLERARAESEWCVKPKHQHLLSVPAPPPCERL